MSIDLGFLKDPAKYFIQEAEFLYFQEVHGVYGRESKSTSINFIQTMTTDLDGWESWGLYVNIKKKALYNLFDLHIKGGGHLHFSDRRCFSERWFRQLTVERPDEKGIFQKPHSHARNEALDCCIYADSAFDLSFKDASPNWVDFKSWNQHGCTVGSNQTSGIKIINEGVSA